MRLLIIVVVALVSGSCQFSGKKDKEPSEPIGVWELLLEKHDLYVRLQPEVDGPSGFIDTDKCDSIHWTALRGVGQGKSAELRAAVEENGKVHRRPLSMKECYPDESNSSIAREAIFYVAIHSLVFNDLELLDRIWAYGKANNWIMGDGVASRTFFTLSAQAQLAQAIRALGGGEKPQAKFPVPRDDGQVDYEAYIQMMGVLLEALSNGGKISQESLDVVIEQSNRQPGNVVYKAMAVRWAGGDREAAAASLSNGAEYPNDRLPTSAEYCDEWLAQRDEGTDGWLPCPAEGRKHSGGDWLLAYWILTHQF